MSMAARPCVADIPPVTLPGTEEHVLHSPAGEYRLWLSIPAAPPPPGGFPLLVLLDANASFATLVEIARQGAVRAGATGIGAAVVAGIAYPGDAPYYRARRGLDYTPGPPAAETVPYATGGRDAFLRFLRGPVMTRIAARAPVDAARRVLIGHSLAGFFALDVLAHDPGAFSDYVAISPSVWWNKARLEAGLSRLSLPARVPRVALGVGEWEQGLTPWEAASPDAARTAERRGRRAMVDGARDMAGRIAAAGAETRFWCFPEENHGSVMPVALGRALRFVLSPQPG
jgi:predicted alpha/beta superfamily hydrolase